MLRNHIMVTGVALVLMLAFVACGEADEPTSPAGGGGGTAPTATVEPEPTETSGPQSIDLDGTRWVLSGFGDRDLDTDIEVTLAFDDGQISGNAGCNDYGGQYEITGDGEITIQDLYATEMACEVGMDIEREFLDALPNAERYRAIEGRLELMNGDGETLLVFGSDGEPAAWFDGTDWTVATIDGEPPLPGTTVTISFADGQLSAYAGCNSIGGEYTAAGDGTFSAPELVMTAMACLQPEGVMDQESALVAALDEVESYRGDQREVELLDAAGEVRIHMLNEDAAGEPIQVAGTSWVLTRIQGSWSQTWPPTTLIFGANGPTGTSGCLTYNLWTEQWQEGEIHDGRLTFSDHLCAEMDLRGAGELYFDVLSTVTTYEAREQRLQMMDETGAVVLTFRRGLDGGELAGTSWNLQSLRGEPLVDGTTITLEFEEENAVGSGGCNSYGGPYMVVDPGIVAIIEVARTEMGCVEPEGVMEQETAYFDTLPRATSYELSDLGLTLFDAHGETLLVFAPASDATGLDGTEWSLETVYGEPVIEGSDPTLSFEDGGIAGWSGCNRFGVGNITVEDTSIAIGHVETTEEGCPEVADQERAFYDALVDVASYELSGDRLEMMNGDGEVLLVFERR